MKVAELKIILEDLPDDQTVIFEHRRHPNTPSDESYSIDNVAISDRCVVLISF